MRVMVALEDRFIRTTSGHIYSNTVFDYNFWKKYLQVFDEVVVLARVCDVTEEAKTGMPANGPGVSFLSLPYYIGAWQYIKQHFKLVAAMKQATSCADAFILRIPGAIGTLLWHQLMAEKIPYAVEVLGSSADSVRTSGANLLVRTIYRLLRGQKEQCEHASAALYITERYLQNLYPAPCWSITCSDVDLADEAIIDKAGEDERLRCLREAALGKRPFHICHAGTMAALYKAQDVLMEAVSICTKSGMCIEMTLLGDGKYRGYFERKAREFGIRENVHFIGQLAPGKPVREQYDKADLFVLCSLTEGQGRVLIEAMARGLPCIGSAVGGIPELLEPECLVAAGEAEALANKLSEVAQDAEWLERMSRRNLEESKKYHVVVLNRLRVEFYKKVAELAGSRMLHKQNERGT